MTRRTHPHRLQTLMNERGITQAALARELKESKQTINKLYKGTTNMSQAWALRLEEVFGVPWAEIMGGDPAGAPGFVHTVLPGVADGALVGKSLAIPEYDVRADMGGGIGLTDLNGEERHPILGEWSIPADLIASFALPGAKLAIIRVVGDSMEPEYHSGERVMVDLSHTNPSPPGTYVLWDGMGLVLKRCELLMNSQPPRLRITSANPAYESYERGLDEVTISGRVCGKWVWK